jgi:8-oxo-dGTP pyrophosphatase MutT (NUDIX family)
MQIGSVAEIIIVAPDGDILILRRNELDTRRPSQWDTPGGHIDHGEYIEDGAVREIIEETGISLDPRTLLLGTTRTEILYNDLCMHWFFFIAHVSEKPAVTLDPNEHQEFAWLPIDKAIEAITYDRQKEALQFIASNGLLT